MTSVGRCVGRMLVRADAVLRAHGVASQSITFAAGVVSIVAGVLLAAGGATGDLRLWLLVPPLGLFRLALDALVDFRVRSTEREVRAGGGR